MAPPKNGRPQSYKTVFSLRNAYYVIKAFIKRQLAKAFRTIAGALRLPINQLSVLDLPAELRLDIFEYALTEDDHIAVPNHAPPALLLVNQQIRIDAMSSYYSSNSFKMTNNAGGWAWLDGIGAANRRKIPKLVIVHDPNQYHRAVAQALHNGRPLEGATEEQVQDDIAELLDRGICLAAIDFMEPPSREEDDDSADALRRVYARYGSVLKLESSTDEESEMGDETNEADD